MPVVDFTIQQTPDVHMCLFRSLRRGDDVPCLIIAILTDEEHKMVLEGGQYTHKDDDLVIAFAGKDQIDLVINNLKLLKSEM